MKRALSTGLGFALVLVTAGFADASDDGGTRSVFAAGAGNRALALGSAFVAIADDASALLWNPGGLGAVPRAEFQFCQAQLNDLEFRESFAAAVYPDWRWGAAAVSVRQYGVSSVDGRDDRNLPTGEFSDRESELALGYGRAFGDVWNIGVVTRVRRQELGSRSGIGLGADLGLLVRPGLAIGEGNGWARDLQFGLAIQNAVEPALRLESESVPDPRSVRAGLALTRPFATGALLAALDVEKARDSGARLHAGLEFWPRPQFALRSGLDGGTFTAGAGFRLGSASFDYAFGDVATGATHRAGVTWGFGRTVAAARLAAIQAEDRRLEERLVRLEQRRNEERVATLLAGAQSARIAGRPEEALEALATLLAIDSTNTEARAMRVGALGDRARAREAAGDWAGASMSWALAVATAPDDTAAVAGLAHSRSESDARSLRSAEIRRLFAASLDAFVSDNLAGARAGFSGVLSREPGDTEAQAMLRRVEAAIERRASGYLQQADALIQAGSLVEAAERIERARQLDRRALGLAAASGALARARERQEAERLRASDAAPAKGTASAPAAAALTRDQLRQFSDQYRRGVLALERGESDEAIRWLESARALRVGDPRVDERLKREYLTRGLERFSTGQLEAAVRMWERALHIDPRDARTLGYIARAQEQMARAREISEEEP